MRSALQHRLPLRTFLFVALAAGLAGCASDPGSARNSGPDRSLGSVFSGRPKVAYSVAESHPGAGVDQLNFFDALEKRDLVSWDDALHASLLLFTGQSPATYAQRAARAKQVGLVHERSDRPAREAITAGELGLILAKGLRMEGAASEGEAMRSLAQAGVLPDFVKENSGISGAQLLTLLAHAEDALATNTAAVEPLTPGELERVDVSVWSQPTGTQPPTRRPTKKPPIDLEEEARKPRPGQVLPGGAPSPAPDATPAPAPDAPPPAPLPVEPEERPPIVAPAPERAPTPSIPRVPRASGQTPTRLDGVASDLRYVAVDRVRVEVVEVLGPNELVQWRAVDSATGKPGDWQTLTPGTVLDERIEVRTGLGTRATLRVGEGAAVVVHRLTRARLERKVRSDGAAQIGLTLYRGAVEASGSEATSPDRPEAAVLVRTPDQLFPARARALIEYDAFRGTQAREY